MIDQLFNKILIANRGEIACRVIKTAKKMGIETVAVYSTADKNSLHVSMADNAYCIGEARAQESYLNIAAIIAAAKESGSEAIHPGYGFLSENPQFAQACQEAGIVFIGPSVAAMQAMASKQLAKQLLEKTKVPLTPGYHGIDQNDATLFKEAQKIGFPVLLKAASGGGGKGMRSVHDQKEFAAELASARREAQASFGDQTLIIEKLVLNPRHIEVQIMADNHNNVVHLYERDCSLQRRHQKIIEEAPAFNLDDSLRNKITQAACDVARAIDYRGAGTVEFLVDSEHHFYFMEMNTRLQVEHPVTEMITGLDLVEWQINIAANLPLPCQQAEINKLGHAIECRIYAEDPEQNFMPSVGQLHFIKTPHGEGIRLDTGVVVGSDITIHYDPMITKLIAWGETRPQALQRLQTALSHYAIGGVKTNITFLQTILQNPRFTAAQITTDFLEKETIIITEPDPIQALIAVTALDYLKLTQHPHSDDPLWHEAFAWQPHLTRSWTWRYRIKTTIYSVDIEAITPQKLTIKLDGHNETITISRNNDALIIDNGHEKNKITPKDLPSFSLRPGHGEKVPEGRMRASQCAVLYSCLLQGCCGALEEYQNKVYCYFPDGIAIVEPYTPEDEAQSTPVNYELTSPMPATVVAILKNKGDTVKQGDRLIVLEAMKMEHTIHAPKDGILSDIYFEIGAQVSEGVELAALT